MDRRNEFWANVRSDADYRIRLRRPPAKANDKRRSVEPIPRQAARSPSERRRLTPLLQRNGNLATDANPTGADFRAELDGVGVKTTRGAFIVTYVLCECAVYRMQLFLYLKACGREELGTWNLRAGVDAPAAV